MVFNELHWSLQINYPVLALLQLLPLLVMALILASKNPRHALPIGVVGATLELALSVHLYLNYQADIDAMQFAEWYDIIGPLSYHAAVDGISVLFMLLTAVLTLMVVVYSSVRFDKAEPTLIATALLSESTLMAQFSTVDLLWFVVFSAIQLIPLGYLLTRWSTSPNKELAMQRFYQFMGTGLLMLLIGTLILGSSHANVTGNWSFNLYDLAKLSIPENLGSAAFFLLFYGLAVRIPLFPLHGWLPLVAEHGTIAIAPVFLLGLKTGIYGLIRFVFPILPEAVMQWHVFVVAFAAAGIFYAALLALMQINMRRLLAFAVVSHTSILVIGLFSLSQGAFEGAVMLAINFGLATSALLLMSGMVFRRTGSMLLSRLGGLFERIPLIGITFLIAGLSIIGMPGTPGFDAIHLVLEASIHQFGAMLTIAAALGNVVAAGFLLWAFQRAFLTPAMEGSRNNLKVKRTTSIETLLAGSIIVILLGTGFYSEPWLAMLDHPLGALGNLFSDPVNSVLKEH